MPGLDFLDTNILVYAYDVSEPSKQRVAQDLLKRAIGGQAVISTQVLAEFATTLLHKLNPAVSGEEVGRLLDVLAPIALILPDGDIVHRAVQAHAKYGLHFYDGMIVASAERARCERIWSEDLNSGQTYFGARVENPFP
jgi:predicted nucleic acid-binding protein